VPATATYAAETIQGGVTLAEGTSQLILLGQRSGASEAAIQVVHSGTFEEIVTQKGLQTALSGGGPLLFTLMENQPFTSGNGATAMADMSMGMTDEPDTYLVAMWTGDITTRFPPSESLSGQEGSFSVQSGPAVELAGWLENGRIALSHPKLPSDQQQEGFNFILFHHDDETFILGFLPDYKYVLPADDQTASALVAQPGQDHSYLVKGFTSGTVALPLQNGFPIPVPILEVNYIERQK
jgi:hypothetical protein